MTRTIIVMLLMVLLTACSQGFVRVDSGDANPYSGSFNNAMTDRCREQNYRSYNPITGNCE
jgi:hypothetical protein